MGYTKLFSEIVMSTVWREPDHVRIVWITMLAMSDRWHVVNASIPGLADASRVSIDQCEDALKILSSPDEYSRSKEHEGRRIEPCDGGWVILNGEKYRNKMSLDERREYNRLKQREYRANKKEPVKSCVQISTESAHTDTDTLSNARFVKPKQQEIMDYMIKQGASENFADAQSIKFFNYYETVGWKVGKSKPMKSWKHAVIGWLDRAGPEQQKTPGATW